MKNLSKIGLVCLIALMLTCVGCSMMDEGPGAMEPTSELKPLEFMLGEWTYEGEQADTPVKGLPWGPGGKFAGSFTNRLVLDGRFMESRWQETNPNGLTSGIDIFTCGEKTGEYALHSYISDGSNYISNGVLDGLTWTCTWTTSTTDGAKVPARGVWQYSPDKASFTSTWELSADNGNTWLYWAKYHAKKK
jgi:hypothetical protein